MNSTPTNAIEAFSFLLQQWVDTTFPAQDRDVPALNALWMTLADALCGSQGLKVAAFQQELARQRSGAKAGAPPIQALEQRLHALVDAGLRELFLVVAVRQSLDQLIALMFPLASEQWKQLAEDIMPLQLQFGRKSDEMPGPQSTFRLSR